MADLTGLCRNIECESEVSGTAPKHVGESFAFLDRGSSTIFFTDQICSAIDLPSTLLLVAEPCFWSLDSEWI